jgi:glycosyltransferase involved in cell wall biosynthesis
MKLLLIEPEYRGHHIALHVNLILEEAIKRNWEVIILTKKNLLESKAYSLFDKKIRKKIKFYFIQEINFKNYRNYFYLLYIQWIKYKSITNSLNKIVLSENPDHIYFVTLDHIDKILSILGLHFKRPVISGMLIYSRIYLKNNFINLIKKILFLRLLNFNFIKNIFVVDQFFYNFCNNKIKNSKIIYTPDPGKIYYKFSKIKSRKKYHLSKNDFVILVYGAIKNSKGIYELLEALNEIKINNIKVIIAGEQTNDIKLHLKNKLSKSLIQNNRLIIDRGFKNYKEEAILFAATDVVWVAYNDNFNGSSAVLYQAGSVKKPVITSNKGLIGAINDKYRIGFSVNINDKKTIINRIVFMHKNKKIIKKLGINNFILSKYHSDKNFSKIICDGIIS